MANFFLKDKSKIQFQDLMSHRIHEILLVASPYDAFILEEDGNLTEQILTEYIGMNFNYAPRVTHVTTGQKALETITGKKFDLIILMLRIEDRDPISLGNSIKKIYPSKPVVLLSFDESELKQLPDKISPNSINRVFIWSGDASVFPAIIKYVEDRKNVKQDISFGDVRAILVIEDSPRMYSVLLPLIYREIMYQTKNLTDRSLSQSKKLLHLRGRPKILLTPNYETAQKFFKKYKDNMIGIISDIKFPRKGIRQSEAGIKFAKWARGIDPSVPILLQSTNKGNEKLAENLNLSFLHKHSPTLLNDLRNFMIENFGFGDFIFRLPSRVEVDRATNVNEFIKCMNTIPDESLLYHASSHHFSNWLAARTEFELASKLRPIFASDFKSVKSLRSYLKKRLASANEDDNIGVPMYASEGIGKNISEFYMLCGGSLGGKARGLGFARYMLEKSGIKKKYKSINLRVPNCAVIGTNEFDRFMKDNNLWEISLNNTDYDELEKAFINAKLSIDLVLRLESFINATKHPLAVRSSSLLEDSQYQPLAGTYETYMLPNNSRSNRKRLKALTDSIKKIYSSTFKGEAKTLLEKTSHRIEEEKMAILIQELVGQAYDKTRYYPTFSGVLQSMNYYPVSYMKRNEGVAYLALGFGRTIVDGEKCLRISPKYPKILPQFYSIKATLQNTQNQFYGLPLKARDQSEEDLKAYSLREAEEDGALGWVGSVVSHEDNNLRDSLSAKGPRVVSFSSVLKWDSIPLPNIARDILRIGKKSLGCPVEIEFAVNLSNDKQPEFCLLQIKPMVLTGFNRTSAKKNNIKNKVFCQSKITLGDGQISDIEDIIIVRSESFDISKTTEIAAEMGSINKMFGKKKRYMLIGPGRWGSADPWLGIPVRWSQISQAKVIAEIGLKDLPVDPSFGSHFFQNITSLNVAYITINHNSKYDNFNDKWLREESKFKSGEYIDWYKLKNPLKVILDGTTGKGLVYKPKAEENEKMNEEESTGI